MDPRSAAQCSGVEPKEQAKWEASVPGTRPRSRLRRAAAMAHKVSAVQDGAVADDEGFRVHIGARGYHRPPQLIVVLVDRQRDVQGQVPERRPVGVHAAGELRCDPAPLRRAAVARCEQGQVEARDPPNGAMKVGAGVEEHLVRRHVRQAHDRGERHEVHRVEHPRLARVIGDRGLGCVMPEEAAHLGNATWNCCGLKLGRQC
mmetsp:Transcript_109794/g.215231  ORF Transcript_109794/g.215231 Transcript_109794/m.215231 type:complete len:203 (+) Transcript_109794:243-851(+)